MRENLSKAFKKIIYTPNPELSRIICCKIASREKRIIRIKLYVFSIIGSFSIIGFIPAIKALFTEFTQSGFYEYFSLLFSSGKNLTSYWKELSFSLAESLPVFNIIFLFSLIFIFLLSLRYVLKQIIKGQLSFSF